MRASVKASEHFGSATARVGGVTLHYWLGGHPSGLPVLLWHGFLGTSYSWHQVMPLLVEAGYRVLVPESAPRWGYAQAHGGGDGCVSRTISRSGS
jgi:hypothetical protein